MVVILRWRKRRRRTVLDPDMVWGDVRVVVVVAVAVAVVVVAAVVVAVVAVVVVAITRR